MISALTGLISAVIVSKAGRPKSCSRARTKASSLSCCRPGRRESQKLQLDVDDSHQRSLHWTSRRKDRAKEPPTHDKEPELLDLRLAPGDGPSLSRQEGLGDGVVGLRIERGGESAASLPESRVGNGCRTATTGAGSVEPIQKVPSSFKQSPKCPASPPQASAAPRSPRPACSKLRKRGQHESEREKRGTAWNVPEGCCRWECPAWRPSSSVESVSERKKAKNPSGDGEVVSRLLLTSFCLRWK